MGMRGKLRAVETEWARQRERVDPRYLPPMAASRRSALSRARGLANPRTVRPGIAVFTIVLLTIALLVVLATIAR